MSDYRAILLDLDGTLLDDDGSVHPRTLASLRRAAARGVRVMIATGRSEASAVPVIDRLGLDTPALIFNGAALYCPRRRRLIEELTLDPVYLEGVLGFAEERGYLSVVMCAGVKYAMAPRSEAERLALHDMAKLRIVPPEEMRHPRAIRVTLFSGVHGSADEFAGEILGAVGNHAYVTHFPLSLLPAHRDSDLLVVDLHPPCLGKAEAFRVLEERYGIAPEEVIAVGDAPNDISMLEGAGLAVAMENALGDVKAAAARVIGPCDSDAIAVLVEEMFPWEEMFP
ncbi:MAG: HAD-IIB family hydrolase [Planctomycetota bacterium]